MMSERTERVIEERRKGSAVALAVAGSWTRGGFMEMQGGVTRRFRDKPCWEDKE